MPKFSNEMKNTHTGIADKENYNSQKNDKSILNKALIDKNNSVVLIEINKFRLMFKIY